MKKFIYTMFAFFMLVGCSKQDNTFVGNEYRLINTPNNAEITLGFDGKDNRFFGVAAINRYFGTYKTDANNLYFGTAGSTMMAGPQDLMEAERAYLSLLSSIKTFRFEGKKLILTTDKNEDLIFEKIGAIETK